MMKWMCIVYSQCPPDSTMIPMMLCFFIDRWRSFQLKIRYARMLYNMHNH